jgi:hypothetical protein
MDLVGASKLGALGAMKSLEADLRIMEKAMEAASPSWVDLVGTAEMIGVTRQLAGSGRLTIRSSSNTHKLLNRSR